MRAIERLGINSTLELILAIICLVIGSCIWFLIGGCICPKVIKRHWIRAIVSILWPVYLICMFLSLPFITLYDCSRTPEEQEKDIREFIKESEKENNIYENENNN